MATYPAFRFEGLNKNSTCNVYPITLNDNIFNIKVEWDFVCDCAFMTLYDKNMQLVKGATALVNNLFVKVDQRILPGHLRFIHKNKKTYEPELNNIAEEFYLIYVNE